MIGKNNYDLVSVDGMGQEGQWRKILAAAETRKMDCILTATVDWSAGNLPFFDKDGFSSIEGRIAFKNLIETRLNARGPQKEKI